MPEREATNVGLPFCERRGAIREEILPVPPKSRTVGFADVDISYWRM